MKLLRREIYHVILIIISTQHIIKVREVLWEALGREISALFAARTGRALQPEHLEFLRNKLLGGDGIIKLNYE